MVGAQERDHGCRHGRLYASGVGGGTEGVPDSGRARPVQAQPGGRGSPAPRRAAYLWRRGSVHAFRGDIHDLPRRRADKKSPPPSLCADIRSGGPHRARAIEDREPGVRRPPDSRPGLAAPARDHARRRAGVLPGSRARVDPVVCRAWIQIGLRSRRGLLRRSGRPGIRDRDRTVLRSAHELAVLLTRSLSAGEQLRRAFTADARPRGDHLRRSCGLLRDGRRPAYRRRTGGHDRVLSRRRQVPPRRPQKMWYPL